MAYDAYYEAIGGKGVKREWEQQITVEERLAWEYVANAVALADAMSRCAAVKDPNVCR